ncbi:MAG: metal ABC transporter permease [Phycisphaeraceae bacterium]|nr:metal ABC transporter permease [Phycisphaeraceae bacterium]
MKTIRYLTDPALAPVFWPIVLAAVAIALTCALLSPIVVTRRLAFVGQGVSHAAFGGVGLAYALGITGVGGTLASELSLLGVVLAFCLIAALVMARLGRDRAGDADTAIGVVLVAAMAVGFLLLQVAGERAVALGRPKPPSVEAVLFGSLTSIGPVDAAIAGAVLAVVLVAAWLWRRPAVFWAFDEPAAEAFGLRVHLIRDGVMLLLALSIVTTMRLAGVILATAMLVLPGAIALRLSRRLGPVMVLSVGAGLVGTLAGLVLSFEQGLQTGPSIVGVLIVLLVGSALSARLSHGRALAAAGPGAPTTPRETNA